MIDRLRRPLRPLIALVALFTAISAPAGEIGTPTFSWGTYTAFGFGCGYIPTYGQTFVGNDEQLTGLRYQIHSESCCSAWPIRVSIYRWDDAQARALGPELARSDTTWGGGGCCWFDREATFVQRPVLRSDARYVLVFTLSPWWSQFGCANITPAIHDNSQYSNGSMFVLNNGAAVDAMFTQSWGFTGYDLNFTVRTTDDCNANGIVDATELSPATDCNANGILDACERLPAATTTLSSGPLGPIGNGSPINIAFGSVRPSAREVTFTVTASADLSSTHEFLFFRVGPAFERLLFTGAEQDCTPLTASVTLTREQFEAAIIENSLQISVVGSPTVDPAACKGQSWVSVQASYVDRWPDCNGNLVDDAIDFCSGASLDCNGNRRPDECDISLGLSTDFDANAQPDECQPDCNGDGRPDAWQISNGELVDCDADGIPDGCELASQPSLDCNSNGRLDSDIASGTSPDCDNDGRIDSCAIAQQVVPDCNGNGVPDPCDISSGTSADCNANGKPDSCDIASSPVTIVTPQQTPFSFHSALQYTITGPRRAASDVQLQIQYSGYSYGAAAWNFRPMIDDSVVGEWYDHYWGNCSSGIRSIQVPRDLWNAAASDGTILLRVTHGAQSSCGSSYCQVTATYSPEPTSRDCNANAIPDSCDFASGLEHDCDDNGIPDSCDIAAGAEDKNGNGYPDPCELGRGDINLDGFVDGNDLGILLGWWGGVGYPTGDLNLDGVIDGSDLGILLGNWGPIG